MFLIVRKEDNEVMPQRQGADWGDKTGNQPSKQEKLVALQLQLVNLPPNADPKTIEAIQGLINGLEDDKAAWYKKVLQAYAAKNGVDWADFECIPVPENERSSVFKARYIRYNGQKFSYDLLPWYVHQDQIITIFPGWVRGNHRLVLPDETDFSELALTEPLSFSLCFYQRISDKYISVELFLWADDEDPGYDLSGSGLDFCQKIVQGSIDMDHQIIIEEV